MRALQSKGLWRGVGFVPTMGALHEGHMSLVSEARQRQGYVVASIFVNPTQFGQNEDLEKYPRTFDRDLAMLEKAGADCVFAPTTQDMYPTNPPPLCHVEPRAFGDIREGQARPDFFRGVATVVTKLFNIVQPTEAFFGQKDVAQCVLIQRMVRDLNMAVKIRVCETKRDHDGLALSSRNAYLQPDERPKAAVLYRALSRALEACNAAPVVTRENIVAAAMAELAKEPLVSLVEYISVACPESMVELDEVCAAERGAVLSAAVRLGSVRLIDNLLCGKAEKTIRSSF